MKSINIPYAFDIYKNDYPFINLYNRITTDKRASWVDIFCGPGIYAIYLRTNTQPTFIDVIDNPNLTNPVSCEFLMNKWLYINKNNKTDIVYIGKGNSLKERIRQLIRFGHGKRNKHLGGEWLWQINNIEDLRLLTSSCPFNEERGYERWLLDEFTKSHNELPLCNRKKGDNVPIWIPDYLNIS